MTKTTINIAPEILETMKQKDAEIKRIRGEKQLLEFKQKRLNELNAIRQHLDDAICEAAADDERASEILDPAFGEVYRYCRTHTCPCGLGPNGDIGKLICGKTICEFCHSITKPIKAVGDAADNVKWTEADIESVNDKLLQNKVRVVDELNKQLDTCKGYLEQFKADLSAAQKKRDELDKHFGFEGN